MFPVIRLTKDDGLRSYALPYVSLVILPFAPTLTSLRMPELNLMICELCCFCWLLLLSSSDFCRRNGKVCQARGQRNSLGTTQDSGIPLGRQPWSDLLLCMSVSLVYGGFAPDLVRKVRRRCSCDTDSFSMPFQSYILATCTMSTVLEVMAMFLCRHTGLQITDLPSGPWVVLAQKNSAASFMLEGGRRLAGRIFDETNQKNCNFFDFELYEDSWNDRFECEWLPA